jgi:hypothetical protein
MVQNTINLKTYLYKDSWKIAGLLSKIVGTNMLIDMKFISDMIEIGPSHSQTSHLINNTNYSKTKENKKGVENPIKT